MKTHRTSTDRDMAGVWAGGGGKGGRGAQSYFASGQVLLSNFPGGKHFGCVNKIILIIMLNHLEIPVQVSFIAITENGL